MSSNLIQTLAELILSGRNVEAKAEQKCILDSVTNHDVIVQIADIWLKAGEVCEARRVFNLITEEIRLSTYYNFNWELSDFEEADYFSFSVYPPGVPIENRWKIPDFLQNGELIKSYYPGKITFIENNEIGIILAENRNNPASIYELTMEAWQSLADLNFKNPKVGDYLIFACYENNKNIIFHYTAPNPPWYQKSLDWTKQCIKDIVDFYIQVTES